MSTGWPGRMCVELRLLEIRRHPDLLRHQHHQRLAGLRVAALGGSELGDPCLRPAS